MKGKKAQPNVLLISVDDMNPWLGCLRNEPFGHPQVQTPYLDQLAGESVLFSNAHCPAPICNPSRTAVLTGMHPTTSGIYGNYCWWRPHLAGYKTLFEYFRGHGYYAAGAGKVFHHCHGFNPPDQWDEYEDQVFDDPWDRKSRVNYPNIEPIPTPKGHPFHGMDYFVHEFDWGSLPIEEDAYGDCRAVEFAESFLGRNHDQPFILACGLFHPHLPWYAPKRFFDLYDASEIVVPGEVRISQWERIPEKGNAFAKYGPQGKDQYDTLASRGRFKDAMHAYLACLSFSDHLVGRVLQALEASPYAEDTMIVFYGDHGFHVGEKQHFGKWALWRESTHVPFIIRLPGAKLKGTKINNAVPTLGMAATLADLCEIPREENWDSRSLLSLMQGNVNELTEPVLCTLERNNHVLISDSYRFIHYADGSEELYDLKNDPLELKNVVKDSHYRRTVESMRSYLPKTVAQEAPGLEAYEYDWRRYAWTVNSGKC